MHLYPRPTGNNVIVEFLEVPAKGGDLVVPDSAKDKLPPRDIKSKWVIVEIGRKAHDAGLFNGQRVLFDPKYAIKLEPIQNYNNRKLAILDAESIIAILDEVAGE